MPHIKCDEALSGNIFIIQQSYMSCHLNSMYSRTGACKLSGD